MYECQSLETLLGHSLDAWQSEIVGLSKRPEIFLELVQIVLQQLRDQDQVLFVVEEIV